MAEPAADLVQNNAETTEGGITGKGFVKGRSGNPAGRPKGLAAATREVLKVAVAEGEDPALALARFWASVLGDKDEKIQWRMQAADRLADRGWGKPPQYAPIEDDDPLDFSDAGTAELVESFDARIDEVSRKREEREARKAGAEPEAATE